MVKHKASCGEMKQEVQGKNQRGSLVAIVMLEGVTLIDRGNMCVEMVTKK